MAMEFAYPALPVLSTVMPAAQLVPPISVDRDVLEVESGMIVIADGRVAVHDHEARILPDISADVLAVTGAPQAVLFIFDARTYLRFRFGVPS